MKLLRELVAAIQGLAAAIDRQVVLDREWMLFDQQPAERDQDAIDQTIELRKLNELNAKAIAQRASWEQVEREHMKVCERRFRQLQAGESMDDEPAKPIRH